MNTNFNTIETISNSSELNKSQSYLDACNQFEIEASQFANNESFMSRKSAEEVSLYFAKAKSSNCEFSIYRNCLAAELWLSKAWNNAD